MHTHKILVVEDDKALRHALISKLTLEGCEVLHAEDGQQGLDIALQQHPDLIIVDIIMPIMDGLTMLEKLRQDEWGKTTQVIILSNLSDVEEVKEDDKRTTEYLLKTEWNLEDLVTKIHKKLKM
jgi:two-component system, sensor histidine kinase and response regulator